MARTSNKSSLGVLFWIASILLISVLYIANHQNIRRVLDNTRFMEIVFEQRDTDSDSDRTQVVPDPVPESIPADRTPAPEIERETEDESVTETEPPVDPASEETLVLELPTEDAPAEPLKTRSVSIYFIRVSDDGRILPEPVERDVSFSDSPLTRTIESLIAGPNADALNRGLLNLIPEGTSLISARIENGVAYLNFNEQFRFNPIGMEGFLAQLQQVVYTATSFSSIRSVQILIDGEILEYLGGEGVYIGSPLTRETFRT